MIQYLAAAAVLTLDTDVDESRKKIADRAARSPARLCSRDGKICYYSIDALSTDFPAFFALLASFLLFVRPNPGVFVFFVLLCPCSSHLFLFGKYVFLQHIFLFLFHLYSVSSQDPFRFICIVVLSFLVGVFVVLSYPVL